MTAPNGVILWEGKSLIDGAPLVAIAVGLRSKSTNSKTGGMVQTYILRSDMPPSDAIKTGADEAICGDCRHRGDGTGKGRSCYVLIFQGPRGVYEAYKRGSYPKVRAHEAVELVRGRMVRLGAYGDPAAIPPSIWSNLLTKAAGFTGYTHRWRQVSPALWSKLCMASVDSEAEMHEAHALGYRTFRVTPGPHENIRGLEVVCPASDEAGKRTTCEQCKACMGTSGKARASIQIAAHGTGKRYANSG